MRTATDAWSAAIRSASSAATSGRYRRGAPPQESEIEEARCAWLPKDGGVAAHPTKAIGGLAPSPASKTCKAIVTGYPPRA